jgi:rhamnosyltransferase
MPEISILIPTRNEARNIGACLDAVYSQKCASQFEVVVTDSGSSDDTLSIARRYPLRIYTIPPENFHHYARKRNFAASVAQGNYLVYLSADAFPASPHWLEALTANFSDPTVAAVYGRHLPKAGSSFERQLTLGSVYGEERIVKHAACKQELGFRYYHFSAVNAAIRRDVWQATPFPEDLKVFEDVGIAQRILDAGWKIVYEPRAAVFHSHNHTAQGLFRRYFDAGVVWRQLDLWDAAMRTSMVREGWRLLRGKLARRDKVAGAAGVAASVSQDLAKCAGLLLGLNERFLPLALKRRLSAFRLYD